MWTDFISSLSRSINITLGTTTLETLVSSTEILHSTLKKKIEKNAQHFLEFKVFLSGFSKGQLISERFFGVFKSTKKPTKFLTDFCHNFIEICLKFGWLLGRFQVTKISF